MEGGSDLFEAIHNAGGFVVDAVATAFEEGDVGLGGLVISAGAGGVAGDAFDFSPGSGFDFPQVFFDGFLGLEIFVVDEDVAVVVGGDPEADEGVGEAEVDGEAVGGEC
jgi:hypothetical protein